MGTLNATGSGVEVDVGVALGGLTGVTEGIVVGVGSGVASLGPVVGVAEVDVKVWVGRAVEV
jgi:hypothetical protein